MPTTKPSVWRQRHAEIERLALLRLRLAACCGCVACHDAERIEELGVLIRLSTERLAAYSERLCEREATCASST